MSDEIYKYPGTGVSAREKKVATRSFMWESKERQKPMHGSQLADLWKRAFLALVPPSNHPSSAYISSSDGSDSLLTHSSCSRLKQSIMLSSIRSFLTATAAILLTFAAVSAEARGAITRDPAFVLGPSSSVVQRTTRTVRLTPLFGKRTKNRPPSKVSTQTLHIQIEDGIQDAWKTMEIVDLLDRGGVGVLPTESGYGLVTRLDQTEGVERWVRLVLQLSGGETTKAQPGAHHLVSLLCSNLATIDEYCTLYSLPKQTFKILKKNLPGPYTFVLTTKPHSHALPKGLSSLENGKHGPKTLGIRMPHDPVLRYFQDELYDGVPLLVASLPPPTDAVADVEDTEDDGDDEASSIANSQMMYQLRTLHPDDEYWDAVDFVVDAGPRPMADGSTVIDLTHNGEPELVREGLGCMELAV